jgi:hypothetical protein
MREWANQWANASMTLLCQIAKGRVDTMKCVKDMKVRMRRTWGPALPGAIVGGASPPKAV